jgi:hypothetical protein
MFPVKGRPQKRQEGIADMINRQCKTRGNKCTYHPIGLGSILGVLVLRVSINVARTWVPA